jgi:hypothetical protein
MGSTRVVRNDFLMSELQWVTNDVAHDTMMHSQSICKACGVTFRIQARTKETFYEQVEA